MAKIECELLSVFLSIFIILNFAFERSDSWPVIE